MKTASQIAPAGDPGQTATSGPASAQAQVLSKYSCFAPKSHMSRQSLYITGFDREEGGGASLLI
jgi:hypothetical protein